MADHDRIATAIDDDGKFIFTIGQRAMTEGEMIRLLNASKTEDKIILNSFMRQAIGKNFMQFFDTLVVHGYRIDIMNCKKQTAVHLAFYDECYRIKKRHEIKSHRMTPQSYLYQPNKVADSLINEWLLKQSGSIDYTDIYGLNCLHTACFMGNIKVVKKCLNSNNVNTFFCDSESFYNNFTPLHFAVINNTPDAVNIVNHLLENGADVNAIDSKGRTPLHLACQLFYNPSNYDELDMKQCFGDQETLLEMYPIPSLAIIELLLEHHSNIESKDKNGNTPLLSIFPDNYYELSRLNEYWYFDHYDIPLQETAAKFAFLVKAGADVSAKNGNGDTIVHLTIKNLELWRDSSYDGFLLEFNDSYHAELVEQVYKVKSDFDAFLENKNGETPLQLAVNYLSYEVLKTLLNHKADTNHIKMNWEDKKLFECMDIVPNYYMVSNLFAIINLFNTENDNISPVAELTVLRFLIHERGNCACDSDLYNLLHYGTPPHIIRVLTELETRNEIDLSTDCSDSYLENIKFANFYIDQTVKAILTNFDDLEENIDDISKSLNKELDILKSTDLQENISLFDAMTKHPYKISQYLISNFDFDVLNKFTHYNNIVRGHFTKSMVRHYVMKYGINCVKYLCPELPDLCCDMIAHYLNNEDIVKIFSITITPN